MEKNMNALQEFRKAAGYTQAELAQATGLSQSLLARLESGSRKLTRASAERLADEYGVSVNELREGAVPSDMTVWTDEPRTNKAKDACIARLRNEIRRWKGLYEREHIRLTRLERRIRGI